MKTLLTTAAALLATPALAHVDGTLHTHPVEMTTLVGTLSVIALAGIAAFRLRKSRA